MKRTGMFTFVVVICVLAVFFIFFHEPALRIEDVLASYEKGPRRNELTITYPLDGTLFPPEIISPIFRWKDDHPKSDTWIIAIRFQDDVGLLNVSIGATEWRPSDEQWEIMKRRSLEKEATVTVIGINHRRPKRILSAADISISTSKDVVGDSVFYREVPLPFIDAVVDPSRIRWRFGSISSKTQPPVVLTDLPVCGNCHSFSTDGSQFAMDVDYANDKGSYVIAPVEENIVLDKSKIITWADYKKDDGEMTFGLLSQISPDGNYVVSTVKDRSIFVPTDGLFFSQLFFPIKGILVVYDRRTGIFKELPGADDPEFVQSNPAWSPDGKHIVFARSKAYQLKHIQEKDKKTVLLTAEEAREFLKEGKTFLFDLYRIPFTNGQGGKPEPIKGASRNGMSNFFARHSPDGKWIVFCKARSFMLLQPDSELYIIPAEGGNPRRMRCNTSLMNSWHSWSSNSKWLIFSSKANTAYTQLFLTHIDKEGNSTPPVLLENFTSVDRAGNIPEFVNLKPTAIKSIREEFVDDVSFVRAANEYSKGRDYNGEVKTLKRALELNPQNKVAHSNLGLAFVKTGKLEEAIVHYNEALRLDPNNAEAHNNLSTIMSAKGDIKEAVNHSREALRLDPDYAAAHNNLGFFLAKQGKFQEAVVHYNEVLRLDPKSAEAHNSLGSVMFSQKKLEEAAAYFRAALKLSPDYAAAHYNLAIVLDKLGRPQRAAFHRREASRLKP